MELHGKKIIVTGAAQGIGASALRAYVAAGAHVAAMDIDAAQGEAIAASATAGIGIFHCVRRGRSRHGGRRLRCGRGPSGRA
jgi:NAD(P)-dependent dehydrogenase (short-subunit alcohol dehydrogenase family)